MILLAAKKEKFNTKTKEELAQELFEVKADKVVCLKAIKLLCIKISIYSSFLCVMLFVSLLEAVLIRNTMKMIVFAIALAAGLWVAYNDIKSVGQAKRKEESAAEQFLDYYEIDD